MKFLKCLCGIVFVSFSFNPTAQAAKEIDNFFAADQVTSFVIEVSPGDQDILRRNPRTYVRATIREGQTVYRDVGVHLKGSKLGSFRPLEAKPSLTLNFDKFVDGQSFHGMDKLYLNNSVEDPTYMSEDVGGFCFRAAGVPTPQTTHALVTLNGTSRGLYVVKQGFDRAWLKQWFENAKGNLYEGGSRADIDTRLEKDVGDKSAGEEDLQALVKAAQETDPQRRWAALQQRLDIDRFLTFAALEVLLWHWDGYCMNKNNYRLYSNPATGKFVFIPHGMDVLFDDAEGTLTPKWQGLVAQAILSSPEGTKGYREKLRTLRESALREEDILNRIALLEKRVGAILEGAEKEKFQRAVNSLRQHVRERIQFVKKAELN